MERELFDWEEFEEFEGSSFQFLKCQLKKDIGPFKKGEAFPFIEVDFGKGLIRLYKEGEAKKEFRIHLEVEV